MALSLPTLPTGAGWQFKLQEGVYLVSKEQNFHLVKWPRAQLLSDEESVQGVRQAARGWVTAGASGTDSTRTVEQCLAGGWASLRVVVDDRVLFQIVPRRPAPHLDDVEVSGGSVSRFAVLQKSNSGVKIELPHSWADLEMVDPDLLRGIYDPSAPPGSLSESLRQTFVWIGLWGREEGNGFELEQWSPHELLFHERSRRYGRSTRFGGTFWAKGKHEPLQANAQLDYVSVIELKRPVLQAVCSTSMSLQDAIEDRRSFRRHDDGRPITCEQISEFLYRTCRTRMQHEVDGVEYISRPHPSGGSAYELDTFVLIRFVCGIEPGLYHYDPVAHRLGLVTGAEDPGVNALLREAAHSSTVDTDPQVVLLFAARVGRILWKYEQMGYAVILKHVGVLMQTMYLVATDMGLASCGIGSGDSDLFNSATGTSALSHVTVGEFLLGSRDVNEEFSRRPR